MFNTLELLGFRFADVHGCTAVDFEIVFIPSL
jgi:hypothetical protein